MPDQQTRAHPAASSVRVLEQMSDLDIAPIGKSIQAIAGIGMALLGATALLGAALLYALYGLAPEVPLANRSTWVMRGALSVPILASVAWMLHRLSHVGAVLRQEEPVTPDLALAFWQLRNAVLLCAVAAILFGSVKPAAGSDGLSYVVNLELGTAYLGLVAAVLTHAVAKLAMRATRLREDNEAIV